MIPLGIVVGLLWSLHPRLTSWTADVAPRMSQDRPVSAVTTQFLDWCCQQLAQLGKLFLVLILDNATRASQSVGLYLAS